MQMGCMICMRNFVVVNSSSSSSSVIHIHSANHPTCSAAPYIRMPAPPFGPHIISTSRRLELQSASSIRSPRLSSAAASASSTAPARMSSAALVKTLVAIAAMAAVAELAAAAKTHTIQWSLGANYGDWSNSNAVSVGDTVVFTYSSPHTVDELLQADYGSCSFGSPVSTDQSGSTSFTFDKAETRYFACAAGGGSHCRQGQKVAITAGASSPGGQSPPATPSGNSAASSMVPGAGELAMKMALGLGVGGALLAAF